MSIDLNNVYDDWADHPLANDVYDWIATCDEPHTYSHLLAALPGLLQQAAVPLYRGLDNARPLPHVGDTWTADPWASATTLPDYAALWAASGHLLHLADAVGVDLVALADQHPDWFPTPQTDAEHARLLVNDAYMHERIRDEAEWIVTGTYQITGTSTTNGLTILHAARLP